MMDLAHIFDKNLYEVNLTLRTFSKVDAFWQRTKLIEIASRRIDDHCSLTSFELELFGKRTRRHIHPPMQPACDRAGGAPSFITLCPEKPSLQTEPLIPFRVSSIPHPLVGADQ